VENPEKVIEQVGRQIAELRNRKGLTQAEIAERLEMTLTNYQRIEHGLQNATIKTLVRIAGAIGVQARDLWQTPSRNKASRGRPRKASSR
jgi:transcriptional regulator with XRE-family HTH domain